MSAPEPSSTDTVTPAPRSEVGGTSFLDLPLELREMIYDLCTPESVNRIYRLPFKTKPAVTGINLLQCSKQIAVEVSRRLMLWHSFWVFRFENPTGIDIDCSYVTSVLHDHALAKIQGLSLRFNFDPSAPAPGDVHGLEFLLKLESLRDLFVDFELDFTSIRTPAKNSIDLNNTLFITGLLVCVLSHIPRTVERITWNLYPPGTKNSSRTLIQLAERYKNVRGSAYTSQEDTQTRGDFGKSLYLEEPPRIVLTTTTIVD